MLSVLLQTYLKHAAMEKETGLVLGHSRGLLTWSSKYLEAATKVILTTTISVQNYTVTSSVSDPDLHYICI
jgi:hypothetical protein